MMNTSYPLTGREVCLNSSANRNKPRPLLVVHSGKTTTGLPDVFRISSSVRVVLAPITDVYGGTLPVSLSKVNKDTGVKPII